MGGSTFTRVAAGVFSGGLSEAAQKKPLQPGSDINRNAVGVKGLGTLVADPIHGVAKALGRAVTPSSPDTPPTLGTPIAAPVGQTPQEELAARRRAVEARQRLGQSMRASDQLTGTLG